MGAFSYITCLKWDICVCGVGALEVVPWWPGDQNSFLCCAKYSWLHLGLLETGLAKHNVEPCFLFCSFSSCMWFSQEASGEGHGWIQAGFSPKLSSKINHRLFLTVRFNFPFPKKWQTVHKLHCKKVLWGWYSKSLRFYYRYWNVNEELLWGTSVFVLCQLLLEAWAFCIN